MGEPFAAGDRVVQIDERLGELWSIDADPGAERIEVARTVLGGEVLAHAVRADGVVVVVTGAGQVLAVDPVAGAVVASRTVEAPFDALTLSDDGRFAVAWLTTSAPSTGILQTPTRIAVIDFDDDQTAATELTLAGGRPTGVVFAPPFTLSDPTVALRYAVVLTNGAVSLVGLATGADAPEQRIVPLVEPGAAASLVPSLVAFDDDDPADPYDMTMYVAAASSTALYAIDLLPADAGTGRTVQPTINQIALPGAPQSLQRFDVAGRQKLLAMTPGHAVVVDTATAAATDVAIGSASRALVWSDSETSGEVPRGLLWAPSTGLVWLVDLDLLEARGEGAARAIQLGGAAGSARLVGDAGRRRAVMTYQDARGLDIVDLQTRRSTAIQSTVQLGAAELVGDTLLTVTTSAATLAAIDVQTVAPIEVEMVEPGGALFVVGDAVLVAHSGWSGWFSAYSLASLQDGAFAQVFGFELEGLLDRGEVSP